MSPVPALPPALRASVHELPGQPCRLVVYGAGQGAPVLLVHSVNAVASAAEVRPLFEHFAAQGRAVYALDLPGYGLSDRSDRPYTVSVMTDAIVQAARWVRARHGNAVPDAVAVSLSCEFLARAQVEHALFQSLTLVSPTGFRGGQALRQPPGSNRYLRWLDASLRGPGWGGFLFRQLTRPGVIRYFLERTWGARAIDEELWAYNCLTARQPGAAWAPLAFLSGILFSTDIHPIYERLGIPTLVVHGVRGDFTDYKMLSLVRGRPHWQIEVMQTGAMPYFELPEAYFALQDAFLRQAASQS